MLHNHSHYLNHLIFPVIFSAYTGSQSISFDVAFDDCILQPLNQAGRLRTSKVLIST